ncbi:MAG: hypothetical protein Q7S19_03250 [bacterium]|nr:hypothetical protein [bacterium]
MLIVVPEFKEVKGQLVFLAGPIQGAEDWQSFAINFFSKRCPSLDIATPRGNYKDLNFDYDKQVDWESFYLAMASKSAGILFWLAKEKTHYCDRSYAQTTRFELAEWVIKNTINPFVNLFIGIEPGFTGAKYIRRRLSRECPEIVIHETLEALCEEVILNVR